MPATEPGRNDSCPCGSGRKYKRCCLLAKATPRGAYTNADRDSMYERIVRFVAREEFIDERDVAAELFWGEASPHVSEADLEALITSEEELQAFYSWLAFDMHVETARTMVDRFLDRHGHSLRDGERTWLDRMRLSDVRLYEILRVHPDEGFDLCDLLTGSELFVHERSATTQLTAWHIIAARIIDGPNDVAIIEEIPWVFPPTLKESLAKELRRTRRKFNKGPMAGNDAWFCKIFSVFIHLFWLEQVALKPFPILTTSDGESLAFTKVVFDVADPERVAGLLRDSPEIDEDGTGQFVWVNDKSEGGLLLGTFVLSGRRLTFEAMSEERGARATAFMVRLAGNAVVYRATVVEDPEQAIAERRRTDASAGSRKKRGATKWKSEIPSELEASIVQQSYEKHYREWVDYPLPALGNRTPRHAARLKTVRPALIALLKQMESGSEQDRREGRPAYDFSWMWTELRIVRE